MKAAVRLVYGSPDTLNIEEFDVPIPRRNELLIRVMATTVNRTDLAVVSGKPYIMRLFTGLIKPTKKVPGTDFAGVVEQVGEGVTKFNMGDRVFGFDDSGLGSQAQYFCVHENKPIALIPEGITYIEAAASVEAGHYALNFLNKVPKTKGKKVLVNGGTGAIGSALIQLLLKEGAEITVVCPGTYIGKFQRSGITKIIDYEREDFTQLEDRYDFVVDAVGKSTFSECRKVLKPEGVYISSELGPGMENVYLPWLTSLRGGQRVVFPLPTNIPKSLSYLSGLLTANDFRPMIDREYKLEDIREAYRYVATGKKIGNVVVVY